MQLSCCSFSDGMYLLCQTHSKFNALNKSRLFVIPAEGTDGVDNLMIDFLQGLTVPVPAERLRVCFDGCVIEAAVGLVVGIEQQLNDEGSAICRINTYHK